MYGKDDNNKIHIYKEDMNKITKEQFFEKIKNKRNSSRNPILREIDNLKINEGLLIPFQEIDKYYNRSTNFIAIVFQTFRRERTEKKFTTRSPKDGSGCYVLRTK